MDIKLIYCPENVRKSKNNMYPAKTIIRFTNRKAAEYCLKNRVKLTDPSTKKNLKMNLRIHESLCQANEKVVSDCGSLKKYSIIKDFYIRNGFTKIVEKEGSRPQKIHHPNDLYDMFEDFYKYENLYSI